MSAGEPEVDQESHQALKEVVSDLVERNATLFKELEELKRMAVTSQASSRVAGEGTAGTFASSSSRDSGKVFVEENACDEDLSTQISTREQLAKMILKYENLQLEHESMKKSHESTVNRLKHLKVAYNEMRQHCYLLEEDKKTLFEHAQWQEEHMRLLQKDVTELNTCNGNSAVLIENLKKENTILQISVAEKSLVGDYSLQAKLEGMQKKIDRQVRHQEEAYGVIVALRSKLRQLEKRYDRVRDQNVSLRDCIRLYEREFETIILNKAGAGAGAGAGVSPNTAQKVEYSWGGVKAGWMAPVGSVQNQMNIDAGAEVEEEGGGGQGNAARSRSVLEGTSS